MVHEEETLEFIWSACGALHGADSDSGRKRALLQFSPPPTAIGKLRIKLKLVLLHSSVAEPGDLKRSIAKAM